jgi:hypothetical protein
VDFLIGKNYISLMLYEYGSSRITGSVKYPTKYVIGVKAQNGEVYRFSGENFSDRIMITTVDVPRLLELLSSGGMLKFNITQSDRPITNYNFIIPNGKGLLEAIEEL